MRTHERVDFRLIVMPCCRHALCWVNPRLPSFCPECGTLVIDRVRSGVMLHDDEAVLTLNRG